MKSGVFKPEEIRIHVRTTDYVDFKKIDPRIKHDGLWVESCPEMSTEISMLKSCFNEILPKLKAHSEITSITVINELLKATEIPSPSKFNLNQ